MSIPLWQSTTSHVSFPSYFLGKKNQIYDADWENPNLLSVIVMRDPISRLLAGDGLFVQKYPHLFENGTVQEWWQYAHEDSHTNNYALRILSSYDCCNGSHTDPKYLEQAKALVSRFTVVLDIQCLNEGMVKLGEMLNINVTELGKASRGYKHEHKPSKDRIPYPEVYNYLKKKNHLDIELYEWSKRLSLVNCSAL